MSRKISTRVVVLTRCLLAAVGMTVGALAMWQVTERFPDLIPNGALEYLFYLVAALLLGLLLVLSAKPILHLSYAFGDAMKKAMGRAQAMDIAGVLIGVTIGFLVAYLAEALLSLVLPIMALRILLDIVIGLIATYVASLLCLKALKTPAEAEDPTAGATARTAGYVLTKGALSSERIATLCLEWLTGSVYVLQHSVGELIADKAEPALENYRALVSAGRVRTESAGASAGDDGTEADAVRRFAKAKKLKVIALSEEEFPSAEECAAVLYLSRL